MSNEKSLCLFESCDKPRTGKKQYCMAHDKQLLLGKPLSKLASRRWTTKEENILREWYSKTGTGAVNLGELASVLNRNVNVICRKAGQLGLTDGGRNWEGRSRISAMALDEYRKTHDHPRGALGMKHSDETKKKISESSVKNAKSKSKEQKREIVIKQMKTRLANGVQFTHSRGSWKSGWRLVGGREIYFRSRWEANYGRYLDWLVSCGKVRSWEHEPETFWFDKIKRGCVSYLPDFKVISPSGEVEYHEVKGWMDDRSKTKIKRMKKYHPQVKLIIIAAAYYKSIGKMLCRVIPDWEFDSKGKA